jgi:signal transduction histidine kinase
MTRRTARWIAWAIVALYIILAAAGLILQGLAGTAYAQTVLPVLIVLVSLVGVWIVTGALIISRHPQHPVGWLLCAGLTFAAIDMFTAGYAAYDTHVFSGSLPGVDLALVWLKLVVLGPLGIVVFTLIILLFPDGRLPSRGWRKVTWIFFGALFLFLPLQAVEPGSIDPFYLPERTNPLSVSASLWVFLKPLMYAAFTIMALFYGVAYVSLIVRLRSSRGDVRQQIKWLVFPAGLFGIYLLLFLIGLAMADDAILTLSIALGQLAITGIVIAIAFAIFRYRLYDVDIILNRALVYGALTACVIGLYVLVVGILGTFFQAQGNLVIALLATGLVAVLFQPLRERLQHWVNRLIYGERDDPVEALSRLGKSLETALPQEQVLPTLMETIAQTLKLPFVGIEIQGQMVAAFGQQTENPIAFPLIFRGETTGELLAAPRNPEDSFTPTEMRLLRNLARQAGAVVRNTQLTADLQRSRQTIVTAREEERLRLRRDLHDGLGPVLASQGLKIAAVHHLLDNDPESAKRLLNEMAVQNETTVAEVRRLVYALHPPELDEFGLAGAVREYTTGLNVSQDNGTRFKVDIQPPGEEFEELPAAVEVAAYRIATEALTNVTRHAHARHCTISFKMNGSSNKSGLLLEITDDGIGFEDDGKAGIGLNSMQERAEEVGGELQIKSVVAQGTRVSASFPLTA